MKIAIAKEKIPGEKRVIMLPEEVAELVKAGHKVYVEKDAGAGIFVSDEEYEKAGAGIVENPEEIYSKDIVIKLKAPLPEEFYLLKFKENIIVSMFHRQQNPWNMDLLKAANSVAVALERIENEYGERLVNCLDMTGEQGMLFSFCQALKVPAECQVLMLGYGAVATGALKTAFSLGAKVKILRKSEYKNIKGFLKEKDILVNAIKWPQEKREKRDYLVTRDMLSLMSKGGIVLDLSIDYPGPIETSRPTSVSDPFYFEEGIKHICIYGYPALSPISSSRLYSRQILPIILEIADKGFKKVPDYIKRIIIYPK